MKRKTIRNHKDFLTKPTDISGVCDCFIVKTKKSRPNIDSRYGLVASKKIFKLATDRNRAKRLLRDWIYFNENIMLDGIDYIFIARNNILETSRTDGRKKMNQLLTKLSTLYKNAK